MTNPNPIDKTTLHADTPTVSETSHSLGTPHSDVDLPALDRGDSQRTTIPLTAKKDNVKAWTLTLLLHLLIAGSLVAYWYFYQRPKSNENLQIQLETQSTTIKKPAIASQSASAATLTTLSSVASSTLSAAAASTPMPAASSTAGRPLANYVNTQQTAPVAVPVPVPTPNNANTIQKVVVNEAPVTQALTSRDIPSKEIAKTKTPTTKVQEKPAQTDKPTAPTSETEARKLSEEIDVNNAELTKLIEQVKTQNQQKIDAATQPDADNATNAAKPATNQPTTQSTHQDTAPAPAKKTESTATSKPMIIATPAEVAPIDNAATP